MDLRKIVAAAVLFTILICSSVEPVSAQTPQPEGEGYAINIYLFWGEGCPHCAKAKPFFESLADKYPEVVLQSYEIYYSEENQLLFSEMAAYHGIEAGGVPTIFFGPYYLVGYSEEMNTEIEAVVVSCIQEGCLDAGAGVVTGSPAQPPDEQAATPAHTTTPEVQNTTAPRDPTVPAPSAKITPSHQLKLPLIGAVVDLDQQSLILSTALIAFIDGFNPCSLWVLSMLMALVLHTGSRKKVLLIGLIFLTVTAAIYALFIAGLFSILRVASFFGWIQVVVAGVALVFAIVNIKDYFWYKQGVSFTISDTHKPGIFQNIRRVITSSSGSIWGLAGATVVMAAGVSLVEFSCTAGFPVLWTNLLVAQKVTPGAFILLLLLYLVIYQIDELVIFGSMVVTLKSSRLEEKQGRILKLFGGVLMLALAVVMLVDPSLMNDLGRTAALFAVAFSAAALILIIHRKILPQLGISIGSEQLPANQSRPIHSDQGEG